MIIRKGVRFLRMKYLKYFTVYGGASCILPDRLYVPQYYKLRMGKTMSVNCPMTFSEKVNWMKIYYHDPLMTIMADKYKSKMYVEKVLGQEYTVPLLGVWNSAEEIDFSILPNKFVIKTNHDGGPIICKDKSLFDCESARKKLNEKLKGNKYRQGREWAYKDIKRRIIAEEYIDTGNDELLDYKFFVFNGEVKFVYIMSEHTDSKHGRIDYFDAEFNELPFRHNIYPKAKHRPVKPNNYEEMISISEKIASWGALPFVRVDLYSVQSRIFVGEMTFYPTNGMVDFHPPEWNRIIGGYLYLPEKDGWINNGMRDEKWIQNILML